MCEHVVVLDSVLVLRPFYLKSPRCFPEETYFCQYENKFLRDIFSVQLNLVNISL